MCPEDKCRKSLAWYYLSQPQKMLQKDRARFVARPNDPRDEKIEEFRRKRSQVDKNKLFEAE